MSQTSTKQSAEADDGWKALQCPCQLKTRYYDRRTTGHHGQAISYLGYTTITRQDFQAYAIQDSMSVNHGTYDPYGMITTEELVLQDTTRSETASHGRSSQNSIVSFGGIILTTSIASANGETTEE